MTKHAIGGVNIEGVKKLRDTVVNTLKYLDKLDTYYLEQLDLLDSLNKLIDSEEKKRG